MKKTNLAIRSHKSATKRSLGNVSSGISFTLFNDSLTLSKRVDSSIKIGMSCTLKTDFGKFFFLFWAEIIPCSNPKGKIKSRKMAVITKLPASFVLLK